ncbi:epimerase [Melghirimyces profundicolus]|uniref:epimerase n=1 Tax=Melghirimyces profundicolus TaxID=1242148 RepID=UPI001FEA257B|nr:epimerase [Melghirimyces profundicolus]
MTKVRDKAILEIDMIIDGRMQDEKIREKILSSFDQKAMEGLHYLIPIIVDVTLHHLLWTIEQYEETVDIVVFKEQKAIRLSQISDGLPGELYTEDGWISRFSQQRYDEE